MKIFVDADACPVVHIVEKLAKKYEIGHCAIGYAAAPANAPASRKDNYVYYVR